MRGRLKARVESIREKFVKGLRELATLIDNELVGIYVKEDCEFELGDRKLSLKAGRLEKVPRWVARRLAEEGLTDPLEVDDPKSVYSADKQKPQMLAELENKAFFHVMRGRRICSLARLRIKKIARLASDIFSDERRVVRAMDHYERYLYEILRAIMTDYYAFIYPEGEEGESSEEDPSG